VGGRRCGNRRGDPRSGHRRRHAKQQPVDLDGETDVHVAVDRISTLTRPRTVAHVLALRCGLGFGLALSPTACNFGETVVTPVIDEPIDTDAMAPRLDKITLSIAHEGSEPFFSLDFQRDEPLELPGVPFGNDLVLHMDGTRNGSKVAYGRTCRFEVRAGTTLPTPHLFFSQIVKFGSLDVRPTPRFGGVGLSFVGSALFIGGNSGSPDALVTQIEKFDPASGALAPFGTLTPRDGAVQALFGDPLTRVVVLGGAEAGVGARFIEVFDTDNIVRIDTSEMARVDLTATTLTSGRVLVIGGNAPGGPASGEIAQITENLRAVEVRKVNTQLRHKRSGHTATVLGNAVGAPVLIAGGIDETGALVAIAELFKPLAEELADPTTFQPQMTVARRGHVAMLMPDGSVLFIGGFGAGGAPVRVLELFSFDTGFVTIGELPPDAGVVDFTATRLPDNRILLTGGRRAANEPPIASAYIASLNSLDGVVETLPTDQLAIPRAGHQAVLLCDGTVLISGGTSDPFPAERYNPPDTNRK
jgi:hypothetical protein